MYIHYPKRIKSFEPYERVKKEVPRANYEIMIAIKPEDNSKAKADALEKSLNKNLKIEGNMVAWRRKALPGTIDGYEQGDFFVYKVDNVGEELRHITNTLNTADDVLWYSIVER